ncbi:hypothetical protein ISCGN_008599 [Ixodes scapularis]
MPSACALVTNFRQESQHLTKGTAVGYVEEIQDSAAIAVISEDASPTHHKGTTPSKLDIDPSLPGPQRRQLTDLLAEFSLTQFGWQLATYGNLENCTTRVRVTPTLHFLYDGTIRKRELPPKSSQQTKQEARSLAPILIGVAIIVALVVGVAGIAAFVYLKASDNDANSTNTTTTATMVPGRLIYALLSLRKKGPGLGKELSLTFAEDDASQAIIDEDFNNDANSTNTTTTATMVPGRLIYALLSLRKKGPGLGKELSLTFAEDDASQAIIDEDFSDQTDENISILIDSDVPAIDIF